MINFIVHKTYKYLQFLFYFVFRKPGIYKSDYIDELFRRYGDVSDAPAVPKLPDW